MTTLEQSSNIYFPYSFQTKWSPSRILARAYCTTLWLILLMRIHKGKIHSPSSWILVCFHLSFLGHRTLLSNTVYYLQLPHVKLRQDQKSLKNWLQKLSGNFEIYLIQKWVGIFLFVILGWLKKKTKISVPIPMWTVLQV